MMRSAAFFICLLFLLAVPVTAQDGYPLPDNLQPITAENADQIKPLASIGGVLPAYLSWSHTGKKLIANTSEGLQLYDVDHLQLPPTKISGIRQSYFDSVGRLIADGHYLNQGTKRLIDPPSLSPTSTSKADSDQKVTTRTQNNEVIIDIKRASGDIISLHTGSHDYFSKIIFSPDEQYAVVVMGYAVDDYDLSRLYLWNVATGKLVTELQIQMSSLDKVMFRGDGKIIVATAHYDESDGDSVDIWDGHTGERIGPIGTAQRVFFSPDNQLMAIFVNDHIQMWTDHLIGSFNYQGFRGDESGIPFAFSPDGTTIAIGGLNQIELWDMPEESIPNAPRLIILTTELPLNLYYSPDASFLVSKTDQGIAVWNARTGTNLHLFNDTEASSISSPVFSRDGQFIQAREKSSDYSSNIQVWDVKQVKRVANLPALTAFSDDGLWAAYWDGGTIRVLDFKNNRQTDLKAIDNNLGAVLSFDPTRELAYFAKQNFVTGYDLQTGQEILHKAIAGFEQFNGDGSYFMTSSKPQRIEGQDFVDTQIWQTNDPQKPISDFKRKIHYGELLLSPDGKWLSQASGACGDGGGGAQYLWNTQTGNELSLYYGGDCGPYGHTFSPDSQWLLVGWSKHLDVISMQEASSDKKDLDDIPLSKSFYDYSDGSSIQNVAFSPDGKIIAIIYEIFDGTSQTISNQMKVFRFADLLTLQAGTDLKDQAITTIPDAQQASFSPNGRWLITDVGLWDLVTGKRISLITARVATFTPDNNLLATYDENTSQVALWDLLKLTDADSSPIALLDSPERNPDYQDELAFNREATVLYLKRSGDIQIYGVTPVSP